MKADTWIDGLFPPRSHPPCKRCLFSPTLDLSVEQKQKSHREEIEEQEVIDLCMHIYIYVWSMVSCFAISSPCESCSPSPIPDLPLEHRQDSLSEFCMRLSYRSMISSFALFSACESCFSSPTSDPPLDHLPHSHVLVQNLLLPISSPCGGPSSPKLQILPLSNFRKRVADPLLPSLAPTLNPVDVYPPDSWALRWSGEGRYQSDDTSHFLLMRVLVLLYHTAQVDGL